MLVRQEEWERWERLVVGRGQLRMTHSCAISKLVDAELRCASVWGLKLLVYEALSY